jgi:hypothetical protein
MAAFEELNWDNPDVYAIVTGRAVGTIEARFEQACYKWLLDRGYELLELDFSQGISPVVARLVAYFDWPAQFGYTLEPTSRNLLALGDGFRFLRAKIVMKLQRFEVAWSQDETWSQGFLSIASRYSIRQLALGRSFFVIVPTDDAESALIGETIQDSFIPSPFRFRRAVD